MKNKIKIEILPGDRIKLTQDQKNLIELAFEKQIPPEDARFIEKGKIESKKGETSFVKLSHYFMAKYGVEFGLIYLSAIMGGEKKYKEIVNLIERSNALSRIEKNGQN